MYSVHVHLNVVCMSCYECVWCTCLLSASLLFVTSLGLSIAQGGITVQRDEVGKETGEAFVEFNTSTDAEKALERNKCTIGHR